MRPGMAVLVFGLAALGMAAPLAAMAGHEQDRDMPRTIITVVCTIYSEHGVADLISGLSLDGYMPDCEMTAEYVETPQPTASVSVAEGSLYPQCADTDNCFVPHTITVEPGTAVTWTNHDNVVHTITESEPVPAFDGWTFPGEKFTFTFDESGTYMYGCTLHPWASGVVVVDPEVVDQMVVDQDAAAPEPARVPEPVSIVQDTIAMYDSEGAAAFETVNSMKSEDLYPFVINAETMTVVAEGAFQRVVGLPAIFLHDADRPLADILAGLESDGVWVEYVFENPRTASQEAKTSYLVLHDGYIFGSGYYTSPDAEAADAVDAMIRLYGVVGEDAFANVVSVPTDAFNAPFVLDADTLDIVAHADPNLSGGDIRDAISSAQPLEFVSDMLDRHGSLWLSYPSADPAPGAEYTRAYMLLRDGYVFASGYGVDAESRLRSLVDESVRLYEREGDTAFDTITSMDMTVQLVYDLQESTIVASSGEPRLVGYVAPLSSLAFDRSPEEFLQLYEQGGVWLDWFVSSAGGGEMRARSWSVLHDDRYIFRASSLYSPEARRSGRGGCSHRHLQDTRGGGI